MTKNHKLLKCVVVGDGGVGKTSLSNVYSYDSFEYFPTCKSTFTKKMVIGDSIREFELRDTPGQDEYAILRHASYYATVST